MEFGMLSLWVVVVAAVLPLGGGTCRSGGAGTGWLLLPLPLELCGRWCLGLKLDGNRFLLFGRQGQILQEGMQRRRILGRLTDPRLEVSRQLDDALVVLLGTSQDRGSRSSSAVSSSSATAATLHGDRGRGLEHGGPRTTFGSGG